MNTKPKHILFQSNVFLDMEGLPVEELEAIDVNSVTKEIMDVFHGFAYTEEADNFATSMCMDSTKPI